MVSSTSEICMLISEQLKYTLQPKRGGGKRAKIRLCTSQRAVPIWNTQMKSALNEWCTNMRGWFLSFSVHQDNFSTSEFCPNVSTYSPCLMPLFQKVIYYEKIWWLHYFWDHLSTYTKSGQHQLPLWSAKSSSHTQQWSCPPFLFQHRKFRIFTEAHVIFPCLWKKEVGRMFSKQIREVF